jgi:hypothetical protein
VCAPVDGGFDLPSVASPPRCALEVAPWLYLVVKAPGRIFLDVDLDLVPASRPEGLWQLAWM